MRGSGASEVSGEGSRPPGRDADGSGPRGYPARSLPALPETWGGGGWAGGKTSRHNPQDGVLLVRGHFCTQFQKSVVLREHSCREQRETETHRITQLKRDGYIGENKREIKTERCALQRDTEQTHTEETERDRKRGRGRGEREKLGDKWGLGSDLDCHLWEMPPNLWASVFSSTQCGKGSFQNVETGSL